MMVCGLEKATNSHSGEVGVGKDVDLIVFLMVLSPPNVTIYFMKFGRRRSTDTKLFSTSESCSYFPTANQFYSSKFVLGVTAKAPYLTKVS